jgi:hypothetical protein
MSRHRLIGLVLAVAIMAGLVALFFDWSASGTFLVQFGQGSMIGALGIVVLWGLLAVAATVVTAVLRLFSQRSGDQNS